MTSPTPVRRYVCPICSAPWRNDSNLCASCGADLLDPDVQAFAGGQAPGQDDPSAQAPAGDAGMLGAGKILGVSLDGLRDSTALRRLGLWGGVLLAVAFVLPAQRLWKWLPPLVYGEERRLETTLKYSWDLLATGPALALLFPLVGALVGLAVAWAPGLPTHVRAKLLAVTGLLGFVLCLGQLGAYGLAPTQVVTLTLLGVLVAGTSMAARVLDPQSGPARIGLVAGAALFALGMLIPTSDLAARLHHEFKWMDLPSSWAVPAYEIYKPLAARAGHVFFAAIWLFLPLVLIPAAAVMAWKRPSGVWDKDGLALRPVAWALLLYVPVLYALIAFSALGWDDEKSKSALVGRMRLLALVVPLCLWAQLGFLGALVARRKA